MSDTTAKRFELSRRAFLTSAASLGAAGLAGPFAVHPAQATTAAPLLTRPIHSTGEQIPLIGMGTWITFNVGSDEALRKSRAKVLQTFFEQGGAMVDSSPMYGSAEEVLGYSLARIPDRQGLFSATKVWTVSKWMGVRQMEASEALWGVKRFSLMQIHNLLDWDSHIGTLKEWKEAGRVRYIGITTSHGRRHEDFAKVMTDEPLDFVQFTYNIVDREVENRLLPLAADQGRAVIINRPFQRGALIDRVSRHPLPDWAGEIDCRNWAQFLLKFIVSHPAVTCAIPATSRVDHMLENMGACRGRLPDADMRRRMVAYVENL